MLRKLDAYIIRKFLGTFFASIALIIIIVVVFDVSEKIGDFIDKKVPLSAIIFDYYLNFIPYFVNMFSALFIFISVIFFTSRMAANTEIVSILSSGISFYRLMLPYIGCALLIGVLNLYLANYLIPTVNKHRLDFETKYIRRQYVNQNLNIHLRYDKNSYFYVESFDNTTNLGYRFTYENINEEGLTEKLCSESIRYDSVKQEWILRDYFKRTLQEEGEAVEKGSTMQLKLPITPLDFARDRSNVEEMTYPELKKFIETEKQRGSTLVNFYEYENSQRMTAPFAAVILTLIGFALSSRKRRGGIGLHLAVGISLAFIFILFMQISKVFATFGNFPIWLAAWVPIIFFSFIAIYLIRTAPK
ncbi:MAG: LptF/LptG family permease [Bacteroidales bacterium]